VDITKLGNKNEELQSQLDGKSEDLLIKKQARHDQLVGEEAVIAKTIKDEIESIDKLQKQIDEIEEKIKQAADPKARNSRAALLVDAYKKIEISFKDSIDKLREKLKLEVQQKASDAFLELTNQPAYTGLKINSNYGLTILDPDGNDVSLRSAGAEQIVAMSLIGALIKCSVKEAPVIMDTPLGRLDAIHRMNIMKWIPEMAEQVMLFVTSTEFNNTTNRPLLGSAIGREYWLKRISPSRTEIRRSADE
jgi:DNA sulfur modification protein DndD